jgi:uncharacterized protein (DUF1501 family)
MRCIECEEIELARVSDARPSQALEVPYAALDGFPAGKSPADLTRRRLLQWGVAGLAAVYGPKVLGWENVWNSVAEAAEAGPQKCVLLLYLAGGNDGLNVVLPSAQNTGDFSAYAAARPTIGRVAGPDTTTTVNGVVTKLIGSQPLAGAAGSQLAFANPVVSNPGGGDNGDTTYGFDKLYGPGDGGAGSDLAVMTGVDAPNYTLSHFDNSDLWFHGNPGGVVSTGWLGRWVDRNGVPDNPLQAISIDTALSKSIRTSVNPVCAISSLSSLGFSLPNQTAAGGSTGVSAANLTPQITNLAGITVGDGNTYLGRSRGTYGVAAEAYNKGNAINASVPNDTTTQYPNTGTLSTRLRLASRLFAANVGTRVITIHWGSFDTHSAQQTPQDNQLKELSRALGAFRNDLTLRGIEQNVMTLVFSEFGRRIGENGSAGTDHGAGGLMLAMGSGVKGGLGSVWPGCEPGPEQDKGNIKVTTDFRSVYKAVIDDWLGGTASGQDVLGGATINDLVRGDGLTGLFK